VLKKSTSLMINDDDDGGCGSEATYPVNANKLQH
jgi:hypothetical protein